MAFKIKDGFRIGTKDVANNAGEILAPSIVGTATVVAAATQDGVALQGRAGGTSSYVATFTPTTLSASRTLTIPDASGTIALTSNIPTVNDGTLSLGIGSAGATNTTVTVGTGTGFSANTATNASYSLSVGPALTNLASTMTGAGTGFLKKNGADTFTLDTSTYLTSQSNDYGTVTVTDTDTGFTWAATGSATAAATGATLTVVSGANINVDVDATSKAIRIAAASGTDVNLSVANDTTNADRYIPFFASATGAQTGFTNADLRFNPSNDTLTIGSVAGASPVIASTSTGTATLFNANVTTLSMGGAATAVNIAASATTTVTIGSATGNNTLSIRGNGTGGTAAITSNVTTGTVNLFTGSTGPINLGSASSTLFVGNLTVNGTTTTTNSTVVTIDDPIFTLGGDTAPGADDNKDRGIEFRWHNGSAAKVGYFGFDDSTGKFTFIPDATNTSEVFSGAIGEIDATLSGANLTGTISSTVLGNSTLFIGTTSIALNRASASQSLTGITSIDGSAATLTTSRTLWGQTFNGSANVTGSLTSVGTNITASAGLTVASAAASNIVVTSGTTGTATLDSGTSGGVLIGNGATAKTITIGNVTGATGIVLNSGTAGVLSNHLAGSQFKVAATAAPTVDLVAITNTGFANVTAGVNALDIVYVGGAAAVESSAARINLTPGSTTGGTWSGWRVVPSSGAASGVTMNAFKADNITGSTGTENIIYAGTGWDNILNYNGTTVIDGTGNVIAGQLSGTIPSAVLGNSSLFVGTTSIALNRASASQALTGITSIDGSAATLTTTRTLWGQNFNGSANVTGSLTSVGTNITASAGLTIASASASNIVLNSGTTGTVTVDSGSTGSISIGTNANAKTITIGNTTGATQVIVNSGTGGIILGTTTYGSTSASGSLTLSSTTNATKGTITVGDSNAGTLTLQGATVNLKVGSAASSGFLKVAATTGLVSIDTATYLTAEADTLATVTGRGATTTTDVQLNNASLVLAPATTAKIWRKALAPATINANTITSIDSWAAGTYRSAKYTIQITQGSKYQVSEVRLIHDGTTVYFTEFSVLETNSGSPIPATFSFAIATGTMTASVTITDAATTNANLIIERTLFAV